MERRKFIKGTLACVTGLYLGSNLAYAETFLTVDQARNVLWPHETGWKAITLDLTREQMKSISKASKVRVRTSRLTAWKSASGAWFIIDQILGKHENIDMAFAFTSEGRVKGLEVLTYRETYGDEIRNPKWRAQFHGKDKSEPLRLGGQIRNITGATLSCKHVTEGVNRLAHTWDQVLRHL